MEQLLRREGEGATLREAVTFYLAHHKRGGFKSRTFTECEKAYIEQHKRDGTSSSQIKTLEKHCRRFKNSLGEDKKRFGDREIHSCTALEIATWLNGCRDERPQELWGWKTRTSVRGSFVSLARYVQETLKAIPQGGHTKTAHPWTLSTLAREAAMSRSLFAERFARVIGITPGNYLLQWRLATAKRLLVREQKSVGEAALAVGYESASGFSTAFSREVGLSPKQFIEIHRDGAT